MNKDMAAILIIIAVLVVAIVAFRIGRVAGISQGFSNAFKMLEQYDKVFKPKPKVNHDETTSS